ncbi:phosphodiester glycosidase family protein [Paenibacillus daejeonensis]|uniref:phosphodiester glycosidase family protein n=1 Tax=Paenibacillus daejeonensis TaxID=135193 RepID=UPI00035F421F|nr:phosphodiester glycosidase family protein [Paenibacillus daejeonensis]
MNLRKRWLQLTLSLALVLSLVLGVPSYPLQSVHAVSVSGATAIQSVADLELIRAQPDGDFRLTSDIVLSGVFTPIPEFTGTLDGDGHSISGLSITATAAQPKAAFIVVNHGRIERVAFESVAVTGLSTDSTYWAGGIVATNRGEIRESYVTGTVTGGYRSAGVAVTNYGVIRHVYADVEVSARVESGGLVAVAEPGSLLEQSYVLPDVYSQENNTGGIAAYAYSGAIIRDNAVLVGTIDNGGGSNIGRIVGRVNGTPTLQNNRASQQTLVQGSPVSGGGLSDSQGLTTAAADLGRPEVYVNSLGWSFSTSWQWSAALARPQLRGVQEAAPTPIATAAQLELLRTNPAGDYVLTADIALTGAFTPIPVFSGTLDGDGHRISGLQVTATTARPRAALIVDHEGVIERLGVVDVDITGLNTNSTYWAGGLVAANHGVIRESFVTGEVTGGYRSAGMVVTNYGTVRDVYTDVQVRAEVEAGGLVAVSEPGSLLSGSYVVPDVRSVQNNTGGLTGYAYAGAVIRDNAVLGGTIDNAGGSNIGRVVGRMNGIPTLQNNRASQQALVQGSAVSGGGLTDPQGLTVSVNALQRPALYEQELGWDLYAAWTWSAGLSRPQLRTTPESAPVVIATVADLELLRSNPAGDYRLTADLVMTEAFEPIPLFSGTLDGNGHTVTGLLTIARADRPASALVVELTGQVERLGLVETAIVGSNGATSHWAAGFATVNRGTIRESFVTGVVTGGYRSAGIAVHNYGRILNSYADLIVKGRGEAAALVAVAESGSLLESSYAKPNVYSELNNTGGLTAYAYTGATIRRNALLAGTIDNGGGSNIARVSGRVNGTPVFEGNRASENALVQGLQVTGGSATNRQGQSVTDQVLALQSTYEGTLGWDFDRIWQMQPQTQRPVLQGFSPVPEQEPHPILYRVFRDESQTLSAGVSHRQMDFIDSVGHVQKANIIDADLTLPQNKIIVGVKNNQVPPTDENGNYIRIEDENGSDTIRGTVPEQMETTVLPGREVIAGVNGEFYTEQGPEGYMIKDGSDIINGVRVPGVDGKNYPFHGFFGIRDDGTPVIGNYSDDWEREKDDLFQASGGQYWMVQNGVVQDFNGLVISDENHPDFDYETYYRHKDRHPRTAAGIRDDGTVFFVVIDGRGANGSVGFYIEELGLYMKELGAEEAINMDGGGSSTAVTRNAISGVYEVKNTPINRVDGVNTPGVARRVFSSLFVVVDQPAE